MSEDQGLVRDALHHERRAVRAALAAGLLVTLSTIALAGTSAWLIVRAAQRPGVLSLTVPMGLVQLFALAKACGRYLERTQTHRAALGAMGRIRAGVANLLEPLLPAGLGPRSAEVVDSVLGDVERVQDLLTALAGPFVTSVGAGVVSVVVCGVIAPWTGLVLFAAVAVDAFVLPWTALRLGGASSLRIDEVHAQLRELFDHVAQSGDEFIMAGAGENLRRRLATLEARADAAQRQRRVTMGLVSGVTVLVNGLGVLTVALLSVSALRAGHSSAALLAVPALMAATTLELVSGFVGGAVSITRDRAAISRLETLRRRPAPVREPKVAHEAPDDVDVEIDALSYSYEATTVLKDLSLRLRRGDAVVIEGPSGAGKTTLARLLAKFLEPTAGRLVLGDVDYTTLTSDGLRRRVGLVDDAPHVFGASLADNLRLARHDATDDDLIVACRDAGLGPFVRSLDAGLDTHLGGVSTGMSGGERRRLGVARELLTGRPIAIFDEPTEGLDDEAAQQLLVTLRARYREGILVIISHQDAGRLADASVWRLEDGHVRVVSRGQPYGTSAAPLNDSAHLVRTS